ncbi:hypothetical protein OIU76_030527 [Salix suchowensis]|nr:hypothetical protein OIU76_030527 [Salix suchowensis]
MLKCFCLLIDAIPLKWLTGGYKLNRIQSLLGLDDVQQYDFLAQSNDLEPLDQGMRSDFLPHCFEIRMEHQNLRCAKLSVDSKNLINIDTQIKPQEEESVSFLAVKGIMDLRTGLLFLLALGAASSIAARQMAATEILSTTAETYEISGYLLTLSVY